MKHLKSKRKEFAKLYITGYYTQKQIAKKIGVTQAFVCRWVRDLPAIQLYNAQKALTKELQRVVKQKDCERNETAISNLIAAIERLAKLIK
jgi:transposase-like protein